MSDPSSGGPSESADGSGDPPESRDGNTLPMRGDTHAPEPRKTPAPWTANASSERPGDRVGSYTLLERIGSGGFGVVWRAERREPYVQQVAIKLLRPGMDSESVLARFEQERQSLAMMDHPNIAKVIDGGLTETGRNYFVMELVKGEPITRFCDRHRLPIERRLELFAQACDAMQHAHMKGIIHRDLKPGNILAAMGDTDGTDGFNARVKIIDFGVAKATARPLTERQLFTEMGQMIGTPEYMSPEQADGGLDVDTRTDIYALGVVLYELLVGATPFDPKSLRSAGLAAIHRIIRESDPPRPSERLRAMSAAAPSPDTPSAITVAQERATRSQTLLTRLRNELEWLPMKAMRKERSERYRSAAEFSDDIRNYLSGKPLIAGPESATYRTRKFVRRHRAAVAAGSLVALVVMAAAVVSTLFWLGEKRQRELAERRERQVREVSKFQQDMLADIVPEEAGQALDRALRNWLQVEEKPKGMDDRISKDGRDAGNSRIARTDELLKGLQPADLVRGVLNAIVLEQAQRAAGEQFQSDPVIQADLLQVLAIIRFNIDDAEAAFEVQRRVLDLREACATASPNEPATQRNLAEALAWMARIRAKCKQDESKPTTQDRKEIERSLQIYAAFPQSPDTDAWLASEIHADLLLQMDEVTKSIDLNQQVADSAQAALSQSTNSLKAQSREALQERSITARLSLGEGLRLDAKFKDSKEVLEKLWREIQSNANLSKLIRFKTRNNLALALIDSSPNDCGSREQTDDFKKGLKELEDAFGDAQHWFGRDAATTQLAAATLAQAYCAGKVEGWSDKVLQITPPGTSSGEGIPNTNEDVVQARARILMAHAYAHRAAEHITEADARLREAIILACENLSEKTVWPADVLEQAALFHELAGEPAKSVDIRRNLMNQFASCDSCDKVRKFVNASSDLACTHEAAGDLEQARSVLEEALRRADEKRDTKPDAKRWLNAESNARWFATNHLADILKQLEARKKGDASTRLQAIQQNLSELEDARKNGKLPLDWQKGCACRHMDTVP